MDYFIAECRNAARETDFAHRLNLFVERRYDDIDFFVDEDDELRAVNHFLWSHPASQNGARVGLRRFVERNFDDAYTVFRTLLGDSHPFRLPPRDKWKELAEARVRHLRRNLNEEPLCSLELFRRPSKETTPDRVEPPPPKKLRTTGPPVLTQKQLSHLRVLAGNATLSEPFPSYRAVWQALREPPDFSEEKYAEFVGTLSPAQKDALVERGVPREWTNARAAPSFTQEQLVILNAYLKDEDYASLWLLTFPNRFPLVQQSVSPEVYDHLLQTLTESQRALAFPPAAEPRVSDDFAEGEYLAPFTTDQQQFFRRIFQEDDFAILMITTAGDLVQFLDTMGLPRETWIEIFRALEPRQLRLVRQNASQEALEKLRTILPEGDLLRFEGP